MNIKPNNGHQIEITLNGRKVLTLEDILPNKPGLKVLFIAKTPAPKSVVAGHYFQGRQGQMFWRRLQEYNILPYCFGAYEDDKLLENGYGLTDIVKVPRDFGDEPSDADYISGTERIMDLIKLHKPKVIVFVYKRVLDQILKHKFHLGNKADYGFNPGLEKLFGCKVFVFPMPGTPCTSVQATQAMTELKCMLNK